jgi:hypothetical protein
MRSDTKALLKIFAWSAVFALLFMGLVAASAVGWLSVQAGAYVVLGCGVVFVVLITRRYGPALHQPEPRQDKVATSDGDEGDDPPERYDTIR